MKWLKALPERLYRSRWTLIGAQTACMVILLAAGITNTLTGHVILACANMFAAGVIATCVIFGIIAPFQIKDFNEAQTAHVQNQIHKMIAAAITEARQCGDLPDGTEIEFGRLQ